MRGWVEVGVVVVSGSGNTVEGRGRMQVLWC